MIDQELLAMICDPNDGSSLRLEGECLVSERGRKFEVVDGIPILLPDQPDTMESIVHSRNAKNLFPNDPYIIDSLGLTKTEKEELKKRIENHKGGLDPVVSFMVGATCGNAYQNLRGGLTSYPIPEFPLKSGNGKTLLDIGCNWGRWVVAAGKNGFTPVGIDPQIGALLAAKRLTKEKGIKAHFVCGDGRFLPFKPGCLDFVYSYSVIQHLSYDDAEKVAKSISRVLKKDGTSYLQMPTLIGLKGFLHRAKNKFKPAKDFEVRYWSFSELNKRIGDNIGKTSFDVDCYFGIGLQSSDLRMIKPIYKPFFILSDILKGISRIVKPLVFLADSVFVKSVKN